MQAITEQDYHSTFRTVIITGSRHWTKPKPIRSVLFRLIQENGIFRFVHGAAKGADTYGALLAAQLGITDIVPYVADWNRYGNSAGPIRNELMLDTELLLTPRDNILVIAFPLPNSVGTCHMIDYARDNKVTVQIYDIEGNLVDGTTK